MEEAKKTKNQSLVKSTSYQIDRPQQVEKAAALVRKYVEKNGLAIEVVKGGAKYVMVEGWQYAGGLMGLFPVITEVKDLGENKWMAKAELIEKKTGKVVGVGYGLCSKEEYKKRTFDEYAILSMAQTRAIGKAFRNVAGFVMKLSGFEATPAEEMKATYAEQKPNTAPKTPDIEAKIKMIKHQSDPQVLIGWRKSINANPNYTLEEKQSFNREISQRLSEIKPQK